MYTTKFDSPVGMITLAGSDEGLYGLWFDAQKPIISGLTQKNDFGLFLQTKEWLDAYFNNPPPVAKLPLKLSGTPFQMLVWQILQKISYGTTTTYGEIAREVANSMGKKTMSAQAIGGAVGKNPVSVIVPCHRVVGANGDLTGYAGGVQIKQALLRHEGVLLNRQK